MKGAPVAVSEDLQQYTYFTQSKNGIRMHTCAPAFQILSTAAENQGFASLLPFSTGPARTAVQLNLTHPQGTNSIGTVSDAEYTSPVWDLIASAFVRYRVKKCVFHYEPQAKATANGRLVFAFAEDPLHPALWISGATSSDLLSVSDSVAFMPWKQWSMDVSHLMDDTLYYTYSDPSNTFGGFTERFSDWGVCACLTDTEAPGEEIGGILYMETVIELEEFCPISFSRPAAAARLSAKLEEVAKATRKIPSRSASSSEELEEDAKRSRPSGRFSLRH